MGLSIPTLGASMKYTKETAEGGGAIKGKDGTSAYARVERIDGGVNLTVTDADGTTSAKINDGEKGDTPTSAEMLEAVEGALDGKTIYKGDDNKIHAIGGGEGADPLDGKTILFTGDSICEGVGANGKPYPYWIAEKHKTANVINMGHGGMTIGDKDGVDNTMYKRILSGEYDANIAIADIIFMQGMINDIGTNVKLGYIRFGMNSPVNVKTSCGGLEYAFRYVIERKKPTARVMFMSTYNCKDYDQYKQIAWWRAVSEICAKYGVEFVDLFALAPTPLLTGSWATQLHAPMPVHRDYIAPVVDRALLYGVSNGAKSTMYYAYVPMSLTFHSGKISFAKDEAFSPSDWRINMIMSDGTTYVNVSSQVKYDSSEVDTSKAGTYRVFFTYADGGVSLGGYKDITVTGTPSEKVLESISAVKSKTEFEVGENVTTNDIVVTGHYNDGSTADVSASATFDTNNVDKDNAGTYLINVSYGGKSTQIAVSYVAVPVPPEPEEWDYEWDINTDSSFDGSGIHTELPFASATLTKDAYYNLNFEYKIEITKYNAVPNSYGQIRSRGIIAQNYNLRIGSSQLITQYDKLTRNDNDIVSSNGWLYNSGDSRTGIITGTGVVSMQPRANMTIDQLRLDWESLLAGSEVGIKVYFKNVSVTEA